MSNTSVDGTGDYTENLDEPNSIPMNAIKVHTTWENKRELV